MKKLSMIAAAFLGLCLFLMVTGCAGPDVIPETQIMPSPESLKSPNFNLTEQAGKDPFNATYSISIPTDEPKRVTTKIDIPEGKWLVLKTISAGFLCYGSNFPKEISLRTSGGASIFLPTYIASPYSDFFSGVQAVTVYVAPGTSIEISVEKASAGKSVPGIYGSVSLMGYYVTKP